jgi:sigma-54-specific transcriptional regulator
MVLNSVQPNYSSSIESIRHDPNFVAVAMLFVHFGIKQADRIAASDATVLIIGETGTGKELIARHVHTQSGRSGPFLAVNCGAFSENLVEAELFGHESGAYTGASGARAGWLEQAVAAGHFRADLYYRLCVATLSLAPLAQRPGDILALAEHFIAVYSRRLELRGIRLGTETKEALLAYSWPGNIRELENVIHYALIVNSGGIIAVQDLRLRGVSSTCSFPTDSGQIQTHRQAQHLPEISNATTASSCTSLDQLILVFSRLFD